MVTSRFLVLALCFVTLFGPYYCYDNPASNLNALKHRFGIPLVVNNATTPFERRLADAFNVKYGLLYSLYSFPNMVLPLLGGVLIDVYGIPKMVLVLITIACVGQFLFTTGTFIKSWPAMLCGRALYGAGCESLYVTQTTILAHWFQGHDMSLALTLLVVSTRSASVVNSLVGPQLSSPQLAFFVGFLLCCASWVAALVLAFIHQRATESVGDLAPDEESALIPLEAVTSEDNDSSEHKHLEEDQQMTNCRQDLKAMFAEVSSLPPRLWLLCCACGLGFPSIGGLSVIAPAMLSHYGHHHSQEVLNLEFASMNAVVILCAPLAGWLVDTTRAFRAFTCAAMVVVCALLTATGSGIGPIPPLVLLLGASVCLSFFAAGIWPCVPRLVAPTQAGAAFGVFVTLQNLGSTTTYAVVSSLQPPACGDMYRCCLLLLGVMSGLAALFAFLAGVGRQKEEEVEEGRMRKDGEEEKDFIVRAAKGSNGHGSDHRMSRMSRVSISISNHGFFRM